MPDDLVVLAQDPRFGGGGLAQTEAFLAAVRTIGRTPRLLYEPHPGLGGPHLSWRRVEALRQLAAARRLGAEARSARSLWVVATLAQHGGAAVKATRPYGCWIGTTIGSEWSGRSPGLQPLRRALAGASIRSLASLEAQVLRGATRVHATSPSSRAAVAAAAGVPLEDVGLLPIPVDVEHFSPAEEALWQETLDKPVVTFLGRVDDPRKNVRLLLDAFARIRAERPTARLRLIGRGMVAFPDGVEAVGEAADPAAELRRAALFVLPSRQEGFGIVAAEALACGLPVVTTPCGGPEQLVHESGGGVVLDAHDPGELAATVLSLLERPDELAEMRRRGRQYVEREHAPAVFAERLRVCLDEVDGA